jgi:hypothetical protein
MAEVPAHTTQACSTPRPGDPSLGIFTCSADVADTRGQWMGVPCWVGGGTGWLAGCVGLGGGM